MASLAHRMALAFEQITADVIEANEFPRLSQAYNVMNVPKTVVNDRVDIVGAVPERQLVSEVLRALPSDTTPDEGP
ncbi:MAG: thioredoxin family protein [Chloroflexota bacterium]|nr:thioredoxin family protein [Chloroflexota bacterium]